MKAITVVVVLGVLIGWWWTRTEPSPVKTNPPAEVKPTVTRPRLPTLTQPPLRTLQPAAVVPEVRQNQNQQWEQLRKFAADVQLTDEQFARFESDLSELAAMEDAAAHRRGPDGRFLEFENTYELSELLERELEARTAEYMTAKQHKVMQFRFGSLVTTTRQLYYTP
jgi:hypothetical protein